MNNKKLFTTIIVAIFLISFCCPAFAFDFNNPASQQPAATGLMPGQAVNKPGVAPVQCYGVKFIVYNFTRKPIDAVHITGWVDISDIHSKGQEGHFDLWTGSMPYGNGDYQVATVYCSPNHSKGYLTWEGSHAECNIGNNDYLQAWGLHISDNYDLEPGASKGQDYDITIWDNGHHRGYEWSIFGSDNSSYSSYFDATCFINDNYPWSVVVFCVYPVGTPDGTKNPGQKPDDNNAAGIFMNHMNGEFGYCTKADARDNRVMYPNGVWDAISSSSSGNNLFHNQSGANKHGLFQN
ncbi:MAG: hypothetical protein WCV63_10760 [Negativicutes bacterium]|jgi:hypothetical protein